MGTDLNEQRAAGMAAPLDTDDEGYLEFVEGLRAFRLRTLDTLMTDIGGPLLERSVGDADIGTLTSTAQKLPLVRFRDRVARSAQEMMYRATLGGYRRREDELLAELKEAEQSGIGSVTYDVPSYPDYLRRADIHIQPGSYDDDPLAGYVYHRITDVFYLGGNDKSQMQQATVNAATARFAAPERILELGGSSGQSATALKIRFPDAEVHSIDIAAPMVAYAHKRAVDMGVDVQFHQMAAEDLSAFEDGSFDLVFAFILFHELPVDVTRRVLEEVRRVLRPGGAFVVLDFASGSRELDPSPARRYIGWFDSNHNGEPYALGFVSCDFEAMLGELFSEVDPRVDVGFPTPALQARVAVA